MKRANLISVVALLAAFAACVASFRPAPAAGVTSCSRIAYDYVKQVADANGLRIDYYQLQACHKLDANHAVARVKVTVDQFGLTQSVTLVYHLTRSSWQATVDPVG